jgi:Glucose-6-phosphate dehydrogenase, NAD binding domain
MAADRVDALVIFGATGDLAKLETFPALVGLVDRGVLDVTRRSATWSPSTDTPAEAGARGGRYITTRPGQLVRRRGLAELVQNDPLSGHRTA